MKWYHMVAIVTRDEYQCKNAVFWWHVRILMQLKENSMLGVFVVMFTQARAHCNHNPRHICLNHSYKKTFSPFRIRILCSKRESIRVLLPFSRHVVPFRDEHCRRTMPVGKRRWARDALSHTFNIGVFLIRWHYIYCNKTYLQWI